MSRPNARPCHVEWIRSIVRQCKNAHVPAFVKQLGANPHEDAHGHGTRLVRLRDRAGADPTEWPADLRIQEMPMVPVER